MLKLIEFKGVSKVYEDTKTKALDNLDIKIENGEFVFIVGSSGAGKSTLLKLMMREEVPSSGSININGYDLNNMKKKEILYYQIIVNCMMKLKILNKNMKIRLIN